MRRARGEGEGGGNEYQVGFTERAIELGKADIVANRECQPPERAFDRHRTIARLERACLVIALVARGKAEEVHLVVARDAPAGVVEHQAGAANARSVGRGDWRGAADEPDALLAG